MTEVLGSTSAELQKSIFGEYDSFAKIIERALHVTILTREDEIRIVGEEGPVKRAKTVLETLKELAARGTAIGSIGKNNDITIYKISAKLFLSGIELVGIGTLDGQRRQHVHHQGRQGLVRVGVERYVQGFVLHSGLLRRRLRDVRPILLRRCHGDTGYRQVRQRQLYRVRHKRDHNR